MTSHEFVAIYKKNINYRYEYEYGCEAIVKIRELTSALLGCTEFRVKLKDSPQH